MSLVADMLLWRPMVLPSGVVIEHHIETPADRERNADPRESELIKRVTRTRMRNIETVFAEVAAGGQTIANVARVTGLGKKVVQRAMVALEADGRIVRQKSFKNVAHRFSVRQGAI